MAGRKPGSHSRVTTSSPTSKKVAGTTMSARSATRTLVVAVCLKVSSINKTTGYARPVMSDTGRREICVSSWSPDMPHPEEQRGCPCLLRELLPARHNSPQHQDEKNAD